MTRCRYRDNHWLYCPELQALSKFYVNTNSDYTFTSFLLAFVFPSEYQMTVDSMIFIHSGYHAWGSDGFSGFTELSVGEQSPSKARRNLFSTKTSPAIQIEGWWRREIQFLTNRQRLNIYKTQTITLWRNQYVLIHLDFQWVGTFVEMLIENFYNNYKY